MDSEGRTLYCKEVYLGAGPNGGNESKPHNIPNLNPIKVHRLIGILRNSSYMYEMPVAHGTAAYSVMFDVQAENVHMWSGGNYSGFDAYARIIYAK